MTRGRRCHFRDQEVTATERRKVQVLKHRNCCRDRYRYIMFTVAVCRSVGANDAVTKDVYTENVYHVLAYL